MCNDVQESYLKKRNLLSRMGEAAVIGKPLVRMLSCKRAKKRKLESWKEIGGFVFFVENDLP